MAQTKQRKRRIWHRYQCPDCLAISRVQLYFGQDRYTTCSYCLIHLCVMWDADGIGVAIVSDMTINTLLDWGARDVTE